MLTAEQAGEILQVDAATVREWAKAGKIPARRFGRIWRFVESELRAHLLDPQAYRRVRFRSRQNALRKIAEERRIDQVRVVRAECQSWHRFKRLQRTPKWADRQAIRAFYKMARRASDCTGLQFHVDHYFPLKGRTVSGLHVPENLRLLPRLINQSKGNRLDC